MGRRCTRACHPCRTRTPPCTRPDRRRRREPWPCGNRGEEVLLLLAFGGAAFQFLLPFARIFCHVLPPRLTACGFASGCEAASARRYPELRCLPRSHIAPVSWSCSSNSAEASRVPLHLG